MMRSIDTTPHLPLTSVQRDVWYDQILTPDVPLYNIGAYARLKGAIDPIRFAEAIQQVIAANDALRLILHKDRIDAGPSQTIAPHIPFQLGFLDFSGRENPMEEAVSTIEAAFRKPFQLYDAPLFHHALYKISDDLYLWFMKYHHLITDGWGTSLIVQRVAEAYNRLKDDPTTAPPDDPSYQAFIESDQAYISSPTYTKHEAFWRETFQELPEPLFQPTTGVDALEHRSNAAGLAVLKLDRELYDKLKQCAQNHRVSLFQTILGAVYTYFLKAYRREDFALGLPTLNRSSASFKKTVGMFVGAAPAWFRIEQSTPFSEMLHLIRGQLLRLYRYQRFPLGGINRVTGILSRSRVQLFDVEVSYQNGNYDALFGDARLEMVPLFNGNNKIPLTIQVREFHDDSDVEVDFEYNYASFSKQEIEAMTRRLTRLFAQVVQHADKPICAMEITTPEERETILHRFNGGAGPAKVKGIPFIQRFESVAAANPNRGALRCHELGFTYAELNAQANRLARYLRKQGLRPEGVAGVYMTRNAEVVIALLAILKVGGVYLPLDPTLPEERLAMMMADAGLKELLTGKNPPPALTSLQKRLPGLVEKTLTLDWERLDMEPSGNPTSNVFPDNLAYIIYTSGSTGRPKGVMIDRGEIAAHCDTVRDFYNLTETDVFYQFASVGFDISLEQTLATLTTGAGLHMRGDAVCPIKDFADLVRRHELTLADLPTAYLLELLRHWSKTGDKRLPNGLRVIITGGELVPEEIITLWRELGAGHTRLLNAYGPTETTVTASYKEITPYPTTDGPAYAENAVIGPPLPQRGAYIVDPYAYLMPPDLTGELCLGGMGPGRGYLDDPARTATRFIPDPFSSESGARMYRTGDIARFDKNGELVFLGRVDHQVKIRGFRVEPGEIESVINSHPMVKQAAVVLWETPQQKQLVAHIIPEDTFDVTSLRAHLRGLLPEHMVPSAFTERAALPINANGKIDRTLLAREAPQSEATSPTTNRLPADGGLEEMIAQTWCEVLAIETPGRDANFFDVGGHSMLLLTIHTHLEENLGRDIPLTSLFRYPTTSSLAGYLSRGEPSPPSHKPVRGTARERNHDIAVIGMACRVPGANDVASFWQNLRKGVCSITHFTEEELAAEGIPAELLSNPNYVKANGMMDGYDRFDARFFNISPREAETMDPQHRHFLQTSWQALEAAGYCPSAYQGRIGVYGGSDLSNYLLYNLLPNRKLVDSVGMYSLQMGNDKDFLAPRVAYKLNLKGPAVNVSTACSTSLVSIRMACQDLINGSCDMALAGGVAIRLPQKSGYLYEKDGIASPDGYCRAFDSDAKGVVGGNGVGVVVLKPLARALADGDHIHAVVKSTAINNDGGAKVGFTAPGPEGQTEVISDAIAAAGFSPETITYVEAHGTGTLLGDPIEVESLTQAFRAHTQKRNYCAIGSVKTNIGHLDPASGVAGFIKTVLALEHGELPPSLHFKQPNPKIKFEDSPFHVNTSLKTWETNGLPRRAGVSSYGIGGTNAHAILEEPPKQTREPGERPYQLLLLSAKTDTVLEKLALNLADHLSKPTEVPLADVAYTLARGREHFECRQILVCRNEDDTVYAIRNRGRKTVQLPAFQYGDNSTQAVVFMFSGQGSQYELMAHGLYQSEPVFRDTVNQCAAMLKPHLGLDIREVVFPENTNRAMDIADTRLAQPALFTIEYALTQLFMAWGVQPDAMIGHSIGEYTAACLAGVFSLEDALRLVALRGRLMSELPCGDMLAVPAPANVFNEYLDGFGLCLAAVNSPNHIVISGKQEAIEQFRDMLDVRNVENRLLHTSHAFHSIMMEPAVEPFRDMVAGIQLNTPKRPFISNVSGTWITDEEATSPDYWALHLRKTVRFGEGISTLLKANHGIFIEMGPGRILANLAMKQPEWSSDHIALTSVRHYRETKADAYMLLNTLGRLWQEGLPIDWGNFYSHERRVRAPLPTYPFEGERYWIDAQEPSAASTTMVQQEVADEPVAGGNAYKRPDLNTDYVAPRDETEAAIAQIWKELLGTHEVGCYDNFFELGGDSLIAVRVIRRVNEAFATDISIADLSEEASVAGLASLVKAAMGSGLTDATSEEILEEEYL